MQQAEVSREGAQIAQSWPPVAATMGRGVDDQKSDLEKQADELYNRAVNANSKQRPSTAPEARSSRRKKKWVSPGPGAYDVGVSKVRCVCR